MSAETTYSGLGAAFSGITVISSAPEQRLDIITLNGTVGSAQLTGQSGGTSLSTISAFNSPPGDPSTVYARTMYFTGLSPYSGAIAIGNFWIGNSPFYDQNNTPSFAGVKNPNSVRIALLSGASFTPHAVTDQSGYYLSWMI